VASAPPLPNKVDTKQLAEAIELARSIEDLLRRAAEHNKHLDQALKLEAESANLSAIMDARNDGKQRAIGAVKLPVEGLSFGDGVVLLDGVPFEQGSDAQRLRVSVAIAMAMNPKLRALRIRHGSELDEDSMKLLAEMLDEADYQCWIERVDSSGKIGFVIEDGHLKGATAAQTPAPAAKVNGAHTGGKPRKGAAAPPAGPLVPEPTEGSLLQESDL
jgi:hypothetical protein